jgi:hypothetical protein
LAIGKYASALNYADQSLKLYDQLIDYNTLDVSSITPFDITNDETLYHSTLCYATSSVFGTYFLAPNTIVDSSLYNSYSDDDLRKRLFFELSSNTNLPGIRFGYSRSINPFSGFATDELYLIKAECQARAGLVNDAMGTLNQLLVNRFETGKFTPYDAVTKQEAINIILRERRKELVFRGLRWQDLRRLNKEGSNITLKRKLGTREYALSPNSNLYALPIPVQEINLSGVDQNPR